MRTKNKAFPFISFGNKVDNYQRCEVGELHWFTLSLSVNIFSILWCLPLVASRWPWWAADKQDLGCCYIITFYYNIFNKKILSTVFIEHYCIQHYLFHLKRIKWKILCVRERQWIPLIFSLNIISLITIASSV